MSIYRARLRNTSNALVRSRQLDPSDKWAVNYRLLVRLHQKHRSRRCHGELVELTVDDVWQIADASDQELQRLAHNIRRGNLELGAEDNDGLSQRACTALAGE